MTRRLRRSHLAVLAAFTAISLTILVAVILLTQTDWGRRRVLAFGLDQLASRVHGEVKVADIRGNLLSGVRLENIEITDTAGRPFLRADTLAFRYSLTSLLRKHLAFSDMHVVNGIVVLDQPPGEEWNYSRIFPTGAPKPHRGPGFGSWIQIHNLQVRNSHLVVRAAWTPRAELSGAERERTITRALAPTNREWIAPINGGYQTISQFYRVNGRFPFLRLADPDSVNRIIEIAELSMIALPFRPPAVDVRDLAALLVVTDDSLLVPRMRFVLAGTRGRGRGAYALNGRSAHAELALARVSLADARFVDPSLPDGSGHLRLALNRHDGRMRIVASNLDMLVEGGTFRGLADFQIGRGTFRVGPSDLRFANVDTRLVKRYINDAPLEAPGTLAGHVRLVGTPAALRVDGNTSYTERGGPTSRVTAEGMVGERSGAFIARDLRLRFNPLYLSLVRKYEPSVPYRGTLVGTTTLTGNSRSGFAVVADLIDTDARAGRSHILANGRIEPRDGLTARNLRLRFLPLQVALLKQLEPEIPYGGTLTGTTTLTGSARRGFAVNADVTLTDPQYGRSRIGAIGRVMVADELIADRLRLRFMPAQTALARPFIDDLPYGGTVSGTATVSGSERRGFRIDADVTHADPEFGRSRIAANGRFGIRAGFTANDL
ncbi:MAG TPA: hypothetical protein VK864_19235, partial [Longimicrobiales bacterium]|nr:hypothetical protein [Longimicrobiales bacterium]